MHNKEVPEIYGFFRARFETVVDFSYLMTAQQLVILQGQLNMKLLAFSGEETGGGDGRRVAWKGKVF